MMTVGIRAKTEITSQLVLVSLTTTTNCRGLLTIGAPEFLPRTKHGVKAEAKAGESRHSFTLTIEDTINNLQNLSGIFIHHPY